MSGLECRYFILKPKGTSKHAKASRMALRAYAKAIKEENEQLASDLYKWADDELLATLDEKLS